MYVDCQKWILRTTCLGEISLSLQLCQERAVEAAKGAMKAAEAEVRWLSGPCRIVMACRHTKGGWLDLK